MKVFFEKLENFFMLALTRDRRNDKLLAREVIPMTFKIKEARQLAKITQKELALRIGVSAGTLSDYENGNHDPKSDYLSKIADECGVTVDFLLGRENTKTPPSSAEPNQEEPGRGMVSEDTVEEILVQLGYIKPGQDLSDDDLQFLLGVGQILSAWFGKGEEGRGK